METAVEENWMDKMESMLRVVRCTDASNTLWTRADCAQYLRLQVSSLNKIIDANDFVEPAINVTGSSNAKGARWLAKDVIQWAMNKRFKEGRPRNEA